MGFMGKNKKILIPLLLAAALLAGVLFLRFRPAAPAAETVSVPPAPTLPAQTPSPSPSPSPSPTPEPTPELFTLSMVGDCTLSSSQYNDDFERVLNGDLSWPFSGTVRYFDHDSLTIANLECSFSDEALRGSVTFQFCAPASHAQILTLGGVDFVTLANNHTDDFGAQGLSDTEAALDAAGVRWAAPDGTCVLRTADGLTVGLYALPWIGTEAQVRAGVAALKAQAPDLIVCCMHWGLEGSYRVTEGQAALGRAAIDAGADIVYGSHPHVLQKVEEYGGGYIFNSLGNWSFGGNTAPRDRDTAILQVTVKRDTDGTVTLEGWKAIPCCLSGTAGINDYRPVPYAEDSEEYARAMSKLDGTWTGADLTIDYSAYHPSAAPQG
jgi:hypothetical protein